MVQSSHAETSFSSCGVPMSRLMRVMACLTGAGHCMAAWRVCSCAQALYLFFYLNNLFSRFPDESVTTERLLNVVVTYVQVSAVSSARQPDYE